MSNLKTCKDCGHQVSKNAKVCPNCGARLKKRWLLWTILGLVLLFILAAIFGSNEDKKSSSVTGGMLGSVANDVAKDQIDQYNIAKKQGDKIQTCVQAGMVTATLLQAKNETEYNKWKAIEKADCKAAGVPK